MERGFLGLLGFGRIYLIVKMERGFLGLLGLAPIFFN